MLQLHFRKGESMTVSKDMKIIDILRLNNGTANIFLQHGLHCLGCPSANGESLKDACLAHAINADELIGELNAYLAAE
jgi:hybrid cluster-associated redox disulfide protein